jgi:hypothetical protein
VSTVQKPERFVFAATDSRHEFGIVDGCPESFLEGHGRSYYLHNFSDPSFLPTEGSVVSRPVDAPFSSRLSWLLAVGGSALVGASCASEATILDWPGGASGGDDAPSMGDATPESDVDTSLGTGTDPDSGEVAPSDADADDASLDAGPQTGCDGCAVGPQCTTNADCQVAIGETCVRGVCALSRTCAELKSRNSSLADGLYAVDVTASRGPFPPFPVFCDMTTAGGGWTRVGYEPAGSGGTNVQGALVYLAVELGGPNAVARGTSAGLIGARFNGMYHELAITWANDYARMTVPRDVFVNEVDSEIPVVNFATSSASLAAWVTAAGGAIFCRASRAADVRPGDSSWAIKPKDSTGDGCGCNDPVWHDRGAFYAGLLFSTSCASRGGAWAGVKDVGQPKAGLASTDPLSIWIR